MTKKTLVESFGTGAAQTATDLTISKTPLNTQGLTALATNTAQGLIAALVKLWASVFTASNRTANLDETITVTYDGQTSRTEGGNVYRVDTYRVQLFKLTPPIDADPDDY